MAQNKPDCSRDPVDTLHETLHGSRTMEDALECDWVKRRTHGQPNTKETAHKKNPPRVGLASTRRVTQFQGAKTPSRDEFRIYSLLTSQSQQRSPSTQSEHRRRCSIPGDLPNNGHVIEERSYTVLNAARTRSRTPKTMRKCGPAATA